jgi:WD40 repeat protein
MVWNLDENSFDSTTTGVFFAMKPHCRTDQFVVLECNIFRTVKTVSLWNAKTLTCVKQVTLDHLHQEPVWKGDTRPILFTNGNLLVALCNDFSTYETFEVSSGLTLFATQVDQERVLFYAATGNLNESLVIKRMPSGDNEVISGHVSRDGFALKRSLLVYCDTGNNAHVVDLTTMRTIRIIKDAGRRVYIG